MNNEANEFNELLKPYQIKIHQSIKEKIDKISPESKLKEAMGYATLNGKRFRPALVHIIAEGLGLGANVMEASIAIEYFHTASLIADDLPCMDNDDTRRDRPSLHKVYGEALALLTSYALISAGFEAIADAAEILMISGLPNAKFSDKICRLALKNASKNTGVSGATGGQLLDLFPPNLQFKTVQDILHKKTTTLFEISFIFGWLFGGGDLKKLDIIKKAAYHFGQAYQIADDIEDKDEDKLSGREVNLANLLGLSRAKEIFRKEIDAYKLTLHEVNLHNSSAFKLATLLNQRDSCKIT